MDFSADAIAFLVSGIILLKKATESDNWVTFPLLSSKDLVMATSRDLYCSCKSRSSSIFFSKERQKMKPITSDCETSLRQENEELCISKQILEKKIEELLDLQEQYKSREVAMTRSLEESGGKVTQLSDLVAFFKSIIPDTKKAIASAEKSIDLLENKCQNLEDIIFAKDRKIIPLVDQILS